MRLRDRKKLRRLMVIQEVSHRDLAKAAGFKSHTSIGNLVRGDSEYVAPDPAFRIAHHLKVAVDDLFMPDVIEIQEHTDPVSSRAKLPRIERRVRASHE